MNNKGFAAFILVVLISSMMLAFSLIASIEYAHYYDEVVTKENRMVSYYASYACLDQAMKVVANYQPILISQPIFYSRIKLLHRFYNWRL